MAKKAASPEGDDGVVDDMVDDGTTITIDTEEENQPAPPTVEDFARAKGWKPKEEWDGQGEWRDATQFLEFGLDRGRDVSRELKELRETTSRMADTQARVMEQNMERVRNEERAKWQNIHHQAVEEGNTEVASQAVGKLTELAAPITPQRDYISEFARENPWFNTDPMAKAVAMAAAEGVKNLPADEQLKAAREAVHKRFPEYAPKAEAKVIEVGDPATRAGPPKRGKSVHDLPAEALEAARALQRRGLLPGGLEGYAKQYFNKDGSVL